jgi:hypothetical protein
MLASHHRRHDCAARPADTASNLTRRGKSQLRHRTAANLHDRATREHKGQSYRGALPSGLSTTLNKSPN